MIEKLNNEELEEYMDTVLKGDTNYDQEVQIKKITTKYYDKIDTILSKVARLEKSIQLIRNKLSSKEFDLVYKSCQKSIVQAENITQLVRLLPIDLGQSNEVELPYETTDSANIKFDYLPNQIMRIELPGLIPFRMKFKNGRVVGENLDYIRSTYINSFSNEFRNGKFKIYEEQVVYFICNHFHSKLKDHDNLDPKIIIDIISSYILFDDSPEFCDFHMTHTMSDKTYSEIYIVPVRIFHEFYKEFKQKSL